MTNPNGWPGKPGMNIPLDLTTARAMAEQAEAAALQQGMPGANITTSAAVYLWLLDRAEEALMQQRSRHHD